MYYSVITESGLFQILDEIKNDIQYYRIVDRNGKDCMQIQRKLYDASSELTLSGVSYKAECTIGMDMETGKPTRDMIRALLVFAFKKETDSNEIGFLDQSSFKCITMDDLHTIEVNLCLHNFILYGKPWYQRYFGAIPYYPEDLEKMNESNQLLEQSYTNVKFEKFVKDITRFSSNIEWVQTIRERIKGPFIENQSKSWRSLFQALFDKSSKISCNLYEEMRPYIVHNFITFPYNDLHMRIVRSTIEDYPEFNSLEFTETPNPHHKKKIANTSNAILYMNGINYNDISNVNSLSNFLNTKEYNSSGGKRHTRKTKPNAIKKHGTYQFYMSSIKGRPRKHTKRTK